MLLDIIPSYTSILLSCNSRNTGLQSFVAHIGRILKQLKSINHKTSIRNQTLICQIILSVYYEKEVARL